MRCRVYFSILLILWVSTNHLRAQSSEFRLGMNRSHLFQTDNYVYQVDHKDGLGFGIQYRVQTLHNAPFLNHFELNLDIYRSYIGIFQQQSSGGAGGNITYANLRTLSLGMNNYFINFGTLHKAFQASLGFSIQYKVHNSSFGEYSTQQYAWDTVRKFNRFFRTYYNMDRHSGAYNPFTLGLCASIGFRTFKIGKKEFRTRYDLWLGLTTENNRGLYFGMINQRLSLGMVIGSVNDHYLKKKQDKKHRREVRRKVNAERLNLKPLISDKTLEFGIGFNLYRFKVNGNDGTISNLNGGFGLGLRIWDWPGALHLPAVSLNFEQVNYNIQDFFLISSISGTFRRNTISAGIYPVKWLLFKKRLDIRAGIDLHFLVSNRANGMYSEYNNGMPRQRTRFNHDVLKLHNRFNAGPVVTLALPLIRKTNYCLRWRNTFAYNFADMTVDEIWGNGKRIQSELTFGWQWPTK